MPLLCTLYEFKKRENSTKRPDDSVTHKIHVCRLKEKTSLLYPDLIFDFGLKGNPSFYNYCYMTDLGNRYYFIRDWDVGPGQLWTAHCEVDVLASWKNSIGNSRQYVLRSSYTYNGNIVDTEYPAKSGPTLKTSQGKYIFYNTFNAGSFVIGVSNSDDGGVGAVHYYVLNQNQFNEFTDFMFGDPGWMGITEISDALTKALVNPMQMISSCFWFPTSIVGGDDAFLKFGYWESNVEVSRMPGDPVKTFTTTIDLPKHPQAASRGAYLNGAPYAQYMLMFQGFGEIALDANAMINWDMLYCTVQLDLVSGAGKLILHDGSDGDESGNILKVVRAQVGVPIQLDQRTTNFFSGVSGVVSGVKQSGAQAAMGNLVGSLAGAGSAIGSALNAAVPNTDSKGSNGSFAEFKLPPTIYATFYNIVDEDNADLGRPLCAVKTLMDIPGYQMISHADISLAATSAENKQIKSYLEAGYFYE